jgi:hypothetical protein
MREPLRILFLTSAHNSLSQRLWIGALGHEICVCVVATDEAMIAAVSREVPDLIIAPMLKIAIAREVWSRHLCLIVHPGIKGDRGPSSLDWAIANHEKIWGVTILEATDEFDAVSAMPSWLPSIRSAASRTSPWSRKRTPLFFACCFPKFSRCRLRALPGGRSKPRV